MLKHVRFKHIARTNYPGYPDNDIGYVHVDMKK